MNRSPLNQTPIGSGSTNNLVRIAITQVLELVGSLRGTVLKYTSIAQEHVLEQSLRATVWVTEKIELICEQVSSLVYGVESGISVSASNVHELVGSCNGTKESNNTIAGECIQESSLTYTVERQVYFSESLEHSLVGNVTGYDLNVGQAPDDRSIVCPAESRSLSVSA